MPSGGDHVVGSAGVDLEHGRLTALDTEIEALVHARDNLENALLCRHDHPLTDCRIMQEETDRRLGSGAN